MPILRGISCEVHTSYGFLDEYLDPESPDPIEQDAKAAQVFITRYLNITGTDNIPFHIQLAFTEESEWKYPIIVGEVAVDGTALKPYTDICDGPQSRVLYTKSEHIQEENGKKKHFEAELYFSKLKIGMYPARGLNGITCSELTIHNPFSGKSSTGRLSYRSKRQKATRTGNDHGQDLSSKEFREDTSKGKTKTANAHSETTHTKIAKANRIGKGCGSISNYFKYISRSISGY